MLSVEIYEVNSDKDIRGITSEDVIKQTQIVVKTTRRWYLKRSECFSNRYPNE